MNRSGGSSRASRLRNAEEGDLAARGDDPLPSVAFLTATRALSKRLTSRPLESSSRTIQPPIEPRHRRDRSSGARDRAAQKRVSARLPRASSLVSGTVSVCGCGKPRDAAPRAQLHCNLVPVYGSITSGRDTTDPPRPSLSRSQERGASESSGRASFNGRLLRCKRGTYSSVCGYGVIAANKRTSPGHRRVLSAPGDRVNLPTARGIDPEDQWHTGLHLSFRLRSLPRGGTERLPLLW